MDFRKPRILVFSILAIIAFFFLIIFLAIVTGNAPAQYYSLNKTIGWAWETYNLAVMFSLISMLTVLAGIILLWIFNLRLNKIVSIINLVILLLIPFMLIVGKFQNGWMLTFVTALLSVILFMVNSAFAVVYKLQDMRKNR